MKLKDCRVIVCSCNVVTDSDIDQALIAIMAERDPPIPTPGVIFRYLGKKMKCCGCAPLLVTTIYERLEMLEAAGRVHRETSMTVRRLLLRYRKATMPEYMLEGEFEPTL